MPNVFNNWQAKGVRSTAFGCPNERERMLLIFLLDYFSYSLSLVNFDQEYMAMNSHTKKINIEN